MSEFKKFQFDNFVIGEKKKKILAPVEVIPTVEAEVVDVLGVEEKTPETEEVKTYSEDELNEQVRIAEEKGYEKGFKTAREGIEAQNIRLWEELNTRLMMLAANSGERECELESQMLDVLKAALHKLVPTLEKEQAKEIVSNFLNDNFAQFKNEDKLAFYFHPETIPYVQENIARLANIHDFEGKISLHKDAALGVADCRIEWENGGVEKNSDLMLEKIDKTLEDAKRNN